MDLATRSYIAASVVLALARLGKPHARACGPVEADALVEQARVTLHALGRNPACGSMKRALARARAVLVFPHVAAGMHVPGCAGGHGVMLVRDVATGQWAGPVFCTLHDASVGALAGPAGAEMVIVVSSRKAQHALTRNRLKLGADVLAYAQVRGLYARVGLAGARLDVRDALNTAYYGLPLTLADILLPGGAAAAGAAALQAALAAAAK